MCVDITEWEATRKVVEGLGQIDLLVNNAGVVKGSDFLTIRPDDIDV